jgi:hypothetical protein
MNLLLLPKDLIFELLDNHLEIIDILTFMKTCKHLYILCKIYQSIHLSSYKFLITNSVYPIINDTNIFCKACELLDFKMINYIIAKGFKNWNETLYVMACRGNRKIIQFLIEKGANNLELAMEGAAKNGDIQLIQEFVDRGACDWDRSMRWASFGGHKDVIKFFLSKGANKIDICMCMALIGDHYELTSWLQKQK